MRIVRRAPIVSGWRWLCRTWAPHTPGSCCRTEPLSGSAATAFGLTMSGMRKATARWPSCRRNGTVGVTVAVVDSTTPALAVTCTLTSRPAR
jgi:hypothetical protein